VNIANELLVEFRSLRRILYASPERMAAIGGPRASHALSRFRDTMLHVLAPELGRTVGMVSPFSRSNMIDRPMLYTYLQADMGELTRERFRAFYLNCHGELIRNEIAFEGTIDECPAFPRDLFRRAFELGARYLVIAHNHPGGSVFSSSADDRLTMDLARLGQRLNVGVIDHIIVAKTECFSLKEAGVLTICPHASG
jgi:DNA repair protein RadC